MNILIIVSKISNGGAERVAVDLYNQFKEENNVYIIIFEKPTINSYKINGRIKVIQNKFKFFPLIYLNPVLRLLRIYFFKRKYKITHSISFSDSSNIANLFSKHQDKVISTVHTYRSKRNISKGLRKLTNIFTLNKSDMIVTPSQGVKNDLINNIGINNDIHCIPNPLSIEIQKNNNEIIKNTISIVTIGRLISEKRQHLIIKAIKKMNELNFDISLKILGEGPEKDSLSKMITDEGIENRVKLLGFVQNPQEVLINSDIFVMTSKVEGFGNAIIEALASGVPVISTDIDAGPREILAPTVDCSYRTKKIELAEFGILIPDNEDEDLLVEDIILAIKELIENTELYNNYRKLGLKRAKYFEAKYIKKQWIKLLEKEKL